jgi:diguanylate cyclase (GGDEF)-like protein
VANTNQVVLRDAFERRDIPLLTRSLDQVRTNPGIVAVRLFDPDGKVVASSGHALAPTSPDGWSFRRNGFGVLTAPIAEGDRVLGSVTQEFDLARLVPQLTRPIPYTDGAVTITDRSGRVILTTDRNHRDDDIRAAAPVADTDLRLVVSAAASAAAAPAAALVWKLGGILFALLGVLALAYAVMVRGRRRLERTAGDAIELAHRDPLTGLANRRAFDEKLEDTMASPGRCGVIAVDMDGLKTLNDRDGHLAGDQGIRAVANALTSVMRPDDFVARIGGDEFVVVLPEVSAGEAMRVAERIRVAVSDVHLSVSCGVAHGPNHTVVALMGVADERLYNAKRTPVAQST